MRQGRLTWLCLTGFLLGLVLTACGPRQDDRAPFAESRTPPSLGAPYLPPEGWAWGYLGLNGGPVRRYGVSSPPVAPRAQIIILPGYGESAEAWFETVRDLNARGFNVWVLEAAGQGGSERYATPRDLGHAPDLQPDADAVRALVLAVIRPAAGEQVLLIASGSSAPLALRAAEGRGFGLTGLVLSDPQPLVQTSTASIFSFRLPEGRASGQSAWRRPELSTLSPRRAAVARWSIANPDLRIGGFSWGYLDAWMRINGLAARPGGLRQIRIPSLVISRTPARSGDICRQIPDCRRVVLRTTESYAWAPDEVRSVWLSHLAAMATAPPSPRR